MIKRPSRDAYMFVTILVVIFAVAAYFRFIKPTMGGEIIYHCRDFKTQVQAQSFFVKNKIKYSYLDANHDGIACNGLPQ